MPGEDDVLALFASILRISEIEDGTRNASFQYFDLSGLVDEIAESYAPVVEDAGRTFMSRICLPAWVHGDRELLAQALIEIAISGRLDAASPRFAIQLTKRYILFLSWIDN